jgi:predicted alpha-1,2-mannosidase
MRLIILLLLFLGCTPDSTKPPSSSSEPADLVSHIDPRIATGGIGFSVGSAYPGPATPFGLVKLSPDTSTQSGAAPGFHHCGGYHDTDSHIQGFSHLHLHGIGVPAHGVVALMPVDGWRTSMKSETGYRAPMDKASERASAGQYSVELTDPQVSVELSTTAHTGLHRYRFSDAVEQPAVVIDLAHTLAGGTVYGTEIEVTETGAVRGWTRTEGNLGGPFTAWFEARFEPPPIDHRVWESGVWLAFDASEVSARVAISMVDAQGAATNLQHEHDGFDLEATIAQSQAQWREALSPFDVWGGTEADLTIFATALYHVLQMPTDVTDVDGRYRGFDDKVHTARGFRYRTDFSLWDTYRTTHPLYTLAWPQTHRQMLRSLGKMVAQGGGLPRWPAGMSDSGSMIGQPAAIVVAEAWQKGLRDFGEQAIFDHTVEVALGRVQPPYGGRPRTDLYGTLGYLPSDEVDGSVSWTQELAIADHALSKLAEGLGTPADAAALRRQSASWEALWDADAGFFHGRLSDGSFEDPPEPNTWESEFVEGTALQYLWLVPHDPEGLFFTLGGEAEALARLDEMMIEGEAEAKLREQGLYGTWYWHGNEPGLHIPWLFALAGDRLSTQRWVDHLLSTAYGTGADGLAGNDDGGTLSAWAVFAGLGIYPLAGTDRYVLGQPRFDRVELRPEGSDRVLSFVRTQDGSPGELHIDGEVWDPPDIRHAELLSAEELRFSVD